MCDAPTLPIAAYFISTRDLSKQVHVARINEDLESGLHSGVTTAPALFINGIQYSDRWNIKQLMAAIIAASS